MPTTVQRIDAWRAAKSETETLEFKEAKNQFSFNELLSYCVAIANEHGGKLLLGIADRLPRRVVGTKAFSNTGKVAQDIFGKLHFRVDVEEVQHPDGRILVFHIPPRPIGEARQLNGTYLMRLGESTVPMTPEQLKKIHHETQLNPAPTGEPTTPKCPNPVLCVQTYMSRYPVSRVGTTRTAEAAMTGAASGGKKGIVTLYLENDGTADLTRAKLHIDYERGYKVTCDQPFTIRSYPLEAGARGIIVSFDLLRPSSAFYFNLTIEHLGQTFVRTNLYFLIYADQLPAGQGLPTLTVLNGESDPRL